MGKFEDFITTSCITSLTFLENIHESKSHKNVNLNNTIIFK